MNADELYEELKSALRYFGLAWGQKSEVQVCIQNDALLFTHGGRTVAFLIPKNDGAPT